MEPKIKYYLIYPLKGGNLATILIPASLFIIGRIFSFIFGNLLGNYAALLGILFNLVIVGFSVGYLPQIVRVATKGENAPPLWEVDRIDFFDFAKGFLPAGIAIIEACIITGLAMFIISLFSQMDFLSVIVRKQTLAVLAILTSLVFPLNLLEYSINEDFDIPYLFSFLDKKTLILIITVFPLYALLIGSCFFIPIWGRLYSTFLGFCFIFYLSQIFSFGLGRAFYKVGG